MTKIAGTVTPSLPETQGPTIAHEGETLSLVTLADDEGTVLLPLFTSIETVVKWRPEGAGVLALPARAIFEMALANGTGQILLDPGSTTNGYITEREIEALARGRLPLGETDLVPQDTEVKIGRPDVPPPLEALGAIRTQLRGQRLAERAWYFLMQQGTSQPQLCIAFQFAEGSDDRVLLRSILDRAGEREPAVQALSFLVADSHWQASLSAGAGVQFYPD